MSLYLIICFIFLHCRVLALDDNELRNQGHLKPIGSQGINLGKIPELRFSPSGQYFYEHYVRKRRPLLIRNAAKHWLATKNWKNETYLRHTYGETPFNINMQKVFDNTVEVRKAVKLTEFLDIYKTDDVYLSSSFPPTNMLNELNLPSFLHCAELSSTVSDLHLLINSGEASSSLHQDGYENILVMLSGKKKVLLFNSSEAQNVYADDFDLFPGFSPINTSRVDLIKYPMFANIKYYESTLNEGDILYMPEYWWHHVRSYECPNIAVNIWFSMFIFDDNFEQAGLSDERDIVKVTRLFDELVAQQPSHIECKDQTRGLDQILKIVLSDTSSESLRIPKTPEKPADFKLASGYTMPALGFGTAGLYPDDRLPAIMTALNTGYRLFDTAQIYDTETVVGEALKQSEVPRSEVVIVSKLHPMNHGYNSTITSVEKSLVALQTDYIDVFLIHTKQCNDGYFKCPEGKPDGVWQDSWRAMEYLHKQGKIRSLGVSNFDVIDLKELLAFRTVPISVLQNWFDPLHQEVGVRHFCAQQGIHFMGYSTLGNQWVTYGGMDKNPVLTSETFLEIASHHQFITSQIILRWAIHLNVTVIPRSHDPRHIVLNYKSLDIALTSNEIKMVTEEYLPLSHMEEPADDSNSAQPEEGSYHGDDEEDIVEAEEVESSDVMKDEL